MILVFDSVLHQTEQAILFQFGDEQKWVPKSVMPNWEKDIEGLGLIEIKDWFIELNSLEDYEE